MVIVASFIPYCLMKSVLLLNFTKDCDHILMVHVKLNPCIFTGDNALSGGEIAGLIMGLLILAGLVILSIFIYRHRGRLASSFLRREAQRTKNFENSLYTETHLDTLSYGGNTGDAIAVEEDRRTYSVSLNTSKTGNDTSVTLSVGRQYSQLQETDEDDV